MNEDKVLVYVNGKELIISKELKEIVLLELVLQQAEEKLSKLDKKMAEEHK